MRYAFRVILCVFLAAALAAPASAQQTCTVYCPDGSRPNVDCNSNVDPCASSGDSNRSTPSYDYEAARRAQEAAEQHRREEAARVERERLAEEQRQRERSEQFIRDRDAAAGTLKGSSGSGSSGLKGLSNTDSYGLKGSGNETGLRGSVSAPTATPKQAKDKRFEKPSFTKGYLDGQECFSSNAGPFCNGQAGEALQRCVNDYRAGYSKGEKVKEQMIKDATARGRRDRDAGLRAAGPAEIEAKGPCRNDWILAYNRGHFGAGPQPISRNDKAAAVPVDSRDPEAVRIINGMNALAKKLGWSADEQKRLDKALNGLAGDGDPADSDQIVQSWNAVLVRGKGADFAREASQGSGPGFPGAGAQKGHQDCAVFALANAAGIPYGVAATRAAELIRQGEWRNAAERANPQKVIENEGLIGGEVVMLAEAFGQAQVLPSTEFAKTLKEGRPVMVNVVPASGNVEGGHEVVLTKTFQHAGETWYEMMDSNQGPVRRLYLSSKELNTILQEKGVAFRAESRTTPTLLR